MNDRTPDPDAEMPRMSLPEHLDELRARLLRCTLATFAGMALSFVYWQTLLEFVKKPFFAAALAVGLPDAKLIALSPGEGFMATLKVCFLGGLLLVGPYVLWQMWGFISAGLYKHEKRAVRVFFPVSIGLFVLGAVAAYLLLIPFGLRFLMGWNLEAEFASTFSVSEYLSSFLTAVFGMGLVFELPLVMLFLQAAGIVERGTFAKHWRIAVVLAFVLGMFLTDPSPVTQILMACPIVGLYFLGIWGGRFVGEQAETFRVWKAWPLVLAIAVFTALLVWSEDLNDWVAGSSASERAAPHDGANKPEPGK